MKYEIYRNIKVTDDLSIFEFISTGAKGNMPKRIEFMPIEIPCFFNLALAI